MKSLRPAPHCRQQCSMVLTLGILLAVASLTSPAEAQDESDSTAYRALTETPLEAFSPVVGPSLGGGGQAGLTLHGRYGLMSFRSQDFIHNFGISGDLPLASGRIGMTAGFYGPTCSRNDCPGHFMASINFEQRLLSLSLGRPGESGSLNLGLGVGVGLGLPDDTTLLSGAATLPITLVPHMTSARIFPFISPGLGVGLVDGEAGMLPTFATGVGFLAFQDEVGMIAGVNRAFLKGGNWLAGVSLTWNLPH
jgi:hypothetical protein